MQTNFTVSIIPELNHIVPLVQKIAHINKLSLEQKSTIWNSYVGELGYNISNNNEQGKIKSLDYIKDNFDVLSTTNATTMKFSIGSNANISFSDMIFNYLLPSMINKDGVYASNGPVNINSYISSGI